MTKVHNAQFQVQSVCVFWKTLNRNVAALQDRGHVLLFQPGAAEVHRKAGTWFDDREIYEWFAKNLHRVREPSMRHYVRAQELKAAARDWTDVGRMPCDILQLPLQARRRKPQRWGTRAVTAEQSWAATDVGVRIQLIR